jgi:uncharacterized protein involved in exopolysaccharide biosynthesis
MGYLRLRWRWIAGACAVAIALTLAVTATMTREYTATARVVIEPPAGSDLRSAMAVSPIYLESLKTYESYAASDSLFFKALDKFGLRTSLGGRPVESLKRRVLKVGILRNTRILEISASLPDPRMAQALASYMADATVALARTSIEDSNRDLIGGIEREAGDVRAHLEQTESAWSKLLSSEPVAELQSAMESSAELRGKLEEQIASAELELADAAERLQQAKAAEQPEIRQQSANARSRLAEERKQLDALDHRNAERERTLSLRMAHRDKLEAERKARLAELAGMEARLRETRGDAGYRGERLRVIDPGIVPERPSSPNLPLNLAAAILMSLALSVLYLTFEMTWRERRAATPRPVFRMRQAGDD